MSPSQLNQWLRDPERGADREAERRISNEVGIPLEAIVFKHERICDLVESWKRGAA